ncbi:MAG TPA: sigma 54-interacting transcriptional regulator [Terriglobia bacterium]|nr:sigma 54-interacting transcriptional regulator [Terriglobia bacterium]
MAERHEALFRLSELLISNHDPEKLLRVLARELHSVIDFHHLAVGIHYEAKHEFYLRVFDGSGTPIEIPELAPEQTMSWWVYQQQQPLVVPFVDRETRFPAARDVLRGCGIRSLCVLPLTTVHRRLGGLAVGSQLPEAYSEQEEGFLRLAANQVALALDAALSHKELLRSEYYLAEGQRLSRVGNWAWKPATGEIFGSREFYRIIDFDPGKTKPTQDVFLALVHPDDRPRVAQQVQEMIAAKADRELDFRVLLPSGSVKHIHEVCHLVLDRGGELKEIIGSFMDVTERKAAEEALVQARAELATRNQRLKLLLDVTNQVVSNLNLRDLLRAISGSVRDVMECDGVGVMLPDEDGRQLRLYALDFPDCQDCVQEEGVVAIDDSPEGNAFRSGKAVVVNRQAPAAANGATDCCDGGKCSCFIPLVGPNRCAGVLALTRLGKDIFSPDDIDFVSQVANQIAIAVENASAYGQIADLKDKLAQENLYLEDEIRRTMNFEEIVGESPALLRTLQHVETVAPTDSTVLIYGETGTGKELVARAIHDRSSRRSNPFVKLNCAAIPTGLLESELFGHEKGAFTGAIAQRIGRFELANRGTIFLDEIGEIPLELQPKLLRVLQEREFERLGSARTLRTDARLIAATNRDLSAMVAEQKFRSDLFYRLNVFPVRVPPLKERPEDIPLLVRHFAQQFSRRMNKTIETIASETMHALVAYHWPGNIRELQNLIERAVILSAGPVLRVNSSELKMQATNGNATPAKQDTLEEAERKHILGVLEDANWVLGGPNGAAARLGLKRSTLQFRMRKLGISRPSLRNGASAPTAPPQFSPIAV